MNDLNINIRLDIEDLLNQLDISEKKLLFQALFNDGDLSIESMNKLIEDTDYRIEELMDDD